MHDPLIELNHEWATIDARRDMRRFMATLDGHPHLGVASARTLEAHIRQTDRTDPTLANVMLLELVRLGRTEPCAQRIVLQALLPGLCCVAQRVRRSEAPGRAGAVSAEIVSLAGWRIATCATAGATAWVASSVLRSVERDDQRSRHKSERELLCPGNPAWEDDVEEFGEAMAADHDRIEDHVDQVNDRLDLVALLNRALAEGVVSRRDLEVLLLSRLSDKKLPELASHLDGHLDTVRRARTRAESRLAEFCSAEVRLVGAA